MTLVFRFFASFTALLLAASAPAYAQNASLVSIQTPRGVKQAFILIKPEKPVASVILFAGGHGALGLQGAAAMKWGKGNFLVRTRDKFAAHNLMVAVNAWGQQLGTWLPLTVHNMMGEKAVFMLTRKGPP